MAPNDWPAEPVTRTVTALVFSSEVSEVVLCFSVVSLVCSEAISRFWGALVRA